MDDVDVTLFGSNNSAPFFEEGVHRRGTVVESEIVAVVVDKRIMWQFFCDGLCYRIAADQQQN